MFGGGSYKIPQAQENRTDVTEKYNPGLLPFWHFDCGVHESVALTSWLTIVLSQLCLILLIFKIVASTAHAWVCAYVCVPARARVCALGRS